MKLLAHLLFSKVLEKYTAHDDSEYVGQPGFQQKLHKLEVDTRSISQVQKLDGAIVNPLHSSTLELGETKVVGSCSSFNQNKTSEEPEVFSADFVFYFYHRFMCCYCYHYS